MKLETAVKRIKNAIKKCELLDTEEKQAKMFKRIWDDFKYFETFETDYTSTANLNFAINIWLYNDVEAINEVINEE